MTMANITGSLELDTGLGEKYVFTTSTHGIDVTVKAGGKGIGAIYIPSLAVSDFVDVLRKLDF